MGYDTAVWVKIIDWTAMFGAVVIFTTNITGNTMMMMIMRKPVFGVSYTNQAVKPQRLEALDFRFR